ncbi:killer cell lectin-like receptor subfamily G member 1 [Penaeus chinensis]|uniref:killer cell lectin-like receptor subfamily G member 1 n=1 Tax=Penaeus chinensis TaxID=139456 RepID=UPI001FB752F1|nr:killer cell lectin-like receptor subfamily G member 1 [Penaeus chinensis]
MYPATCILRALYNCQDAVYSTSCHQKIASVSRVLVGSCCKMTSLTCLLFTVVYLVLLPNLAVSQLQRNCPDNYVLLADKCYGFRHTMTDWNNARGSCLNENADLTSVLTTQEYTEILAHLAANYPGVYWIGGATRNQGAWRWVASGAPMNEQWWGGDHTPTSQRCAYFCSVTRKYWSSACEVSKNYICEKSAETETDQEEEFEPEREVETDEDSDPENEADDEDAERIPSLPSVRAELRSGVSSTTRNMGFLVFLLSFCAAMA